MSKRLNVYGFTLIELMVCVALISIIAAISIPKLNITNYKHKRISKDLYWDIRWLKNANMAESTAYRIIISQDRYTIFKGTETIAEFVIDSNFKLRYNYSSNPVEISFNPNGSMSLGGSGATIKVINTKTKRYYKITITPVNGRIRLYENLYKD